MSQVIPNGGTRASQDNYVGDPREVTVDDSNQELRLHDGSTPGGRRIINLDSAQQLFQRRSDELDAFANFEPAQFGFLARISAGIYRLRKLVVAPSLTIQYPDGRDGNPRLDLADEIQGDRTFVGSVRIGEDVIINGVMQVDGGINADTAGNHQGTHVGDVDVRGATIEFDPGQIPFEAISGYVAPVIPSEVKSGMVIMWAPDLCDSFGLEFMRRNQWYADLRERFILGAGDESQQLGVGGDETHLHVTTVEPDGEHGHTGTVLEHQLSFLEMPSHRHISGVNDKAGGGQLYSYGSVAVPNTPDSIDNNSSNGTMSGYTSTDGGDMPHSHGLTIDANGLHSHVVSQEAAGHIPPYVALAFIMKVG